MQFLYAKYINNIDHDHNIVELTNSIDTLHNLYIYIIKLILIIRNKAKESFKKSISDFFLKNNVINLLMNNIYISNFNEKLFQFHLINDYDILMLLNEFCNSSLYKDYINTTTSFLRDKNFLIKYYECFIMKKLYKVFSDNPITLDLNYAHLMVYNTLKNINHNNVNLYKLNIDYKNFIINLYCKTLTNKFKFNKLISNVLINWDIKRIAILDLIVMHMAICEFLYFPNIPTKVTLNEYIEIIKLFSTIKSPIFINSILD
ncbi:MAG: transcription antitermination protein NusB, partial [Flavobacteriia bacterium]|nr:transcription antitermination protein NusB [Candidatus Bostrichicola ureolyticus]